jgi:hypothetical protein
MWEPRRLTTLLSPTACYRDSFTFWLSLKSYIYQTSSFGVWFYILFIQFINMRGSVHFRPPVLWIHFFFSRMLWYLHVIFYQNWNVHVEARSLIRWVTDSSIRQTKRSHGTKNWCRGRRTIGQAKRHEHKPRVFRNHSVHFVSTIYCSSRTLSGQG